MSLGINIRLRSIGREFLSIKVFLRLSGDILDQARLAYVFANEDKMGRPITTIMHFAALKSAPESIGMPF